MKALPVRSRPMTLLLSLEALYSQIVHIAPQVLFQEAVQGPRMLNARENERTLGSHFLADPHSADCPRVPNVK